MEAPSLRIARQALVTFGPTMSQLFWKKIAWKPSGPGAFEGFMSKRAQRICSAVNREAREERASSEKVLWMARAAPSTSSGDGFEEEKILEKKSIKEGRAARNCWEEKEPNNLNPKLS